jgi:hypothetical protein
MHIAAGKHAIEIFTRTDVSELTPLFSVSLVKKLLENVAGIVSNEAFLFLDLWECIVTTGSRVSSVSIVSDYWLDDRAIGVRSPAGEEDFSSSLCIQTGSGAHPASCTMGTGGPFPGGKAQPGRDADHSPTSSAEVVNE